VALLRNTQFREDAGPTAHPVQPDAYQAIDNFYTTTIYEKGSEVIRMLHTLLGEETFMRGMALYVARHDGSAATCADFVEAMEDAATEELAAETLAAGPTAPRFDFAQFRRWYHQAGTPVLQVQRHWDGEAGVLELQIRQHTPPTPGQPEKQPLVIPLALGLIDQVGVPLAVRLEGEAEPPMDHPSGTRLLVIQQAEQRLRLVDLPRQHHPPALSLMRQFSAPVKLELGRPTAELVHLLAADRDPFARWDAGQELWRQALLARASGDGALAQALEEQLVDACGRILADPSLADASRSALLALPGLAELEDAAVAAGQEPDPPALFAAQQQLQGRFGQALAEPLAAALADCSDGWGRPWPDGEGARRLTALAWSWRAAAGDQGVIAAARAAVDGPSMTLARAGLRALQPLAIPERETAMEAFYQRWQHRPVILDAWFAMEAAAPLADGLERVARLLEHPRYDPMAPNSVRAVLGGLAANTPVFHAADGSGYRFMANQIAVVDRRNPITASRLAKVFSRWRSYGPRRSAAMVAALEQLAAGELSANTREVVGLCLAAG
jgi:aminopeptidase N